MTKKESTQVVRCAVYTRKSTEEGLNQEFNSLDAQRESAESYIASMKHEGWICLPERYDDGGYSGGTTDRPALQRLMQAIESGGIDCVLVYKVDRFSRSLLDFAKLMEALERQKVSFVSVTQHFNTATSMGRLMQNVLLSFAQFEREIISERTRDKIAAARRKGKWTGGRPILGYDLNPERTRLVVNLDEAKVVSEIFALYLKRRSLIRVAEELNRRGVRTKCCPTRAGKSWGGKQWDKVKVHALLTNVGYIGQVRHHRETFPGEHEAIVALDVWSEVQSTLSENGRSGGMHVRNKYGALLKGLLRCKPCGCMMSHSYSVKARSRAYRYYVCLNAQKKGRDACPCRSLPAEQIEHFVVERIRSLVDDSELLSLTLAKAREHASASRSEAEAALAEARADLAALHKALRDVVASPAANTAERLADIQARLGQAEAEVAALERRRAEADLPIEKEIVDGLVTGFDRVWRSLSPNERARVVRLLIQRIEYDDQSDSVAITFHPSGLRTLGAQVPDMTGVEH